ncbi:hypothetical protein D7V97_20575 [Corallococcus sp. CA053C]|nr:hypothetical protein D7V97_20575 [Corallococcus sp. CA053C]
MHHSDRGSPYASTDDQRALATRGIRCSMSRKAPVHRVRASSPASPLPQAARLPLPASALPPLEGAEMAGVSRPERRRHGLL